MTQAKTKMTAKKKVGRKSIYTKELADKIVELIADGKSERKISKMKDMPHRDTINQWKRDPNKKEFSDRIIDARASAAELWDDKRKETVEELKKYILNTIFNKEIVDPGVVRGYDLILREYARSAANCDDSRFGDRKKVQMTGKDDGPIEVKQEIDLSHVKTENLKAVREMLYGTETADTN